MKRLALLITIIVLPIVAYFQYNKFTRFNPPTEYDYPISDSIDVNYYDQEIVRQYYENAYKIEGIARELWYNKKIDVRYPDDNTEGSRNAAAYYNQLMATTRLLEDKLKYSLRLKVQGFGNKAIHMIIEQGISEKEYFYVHNKNLLDLKFGDEGEEVWHLQKILREKDYQMPHDGVFGLETLDGLKDFQTKNNLFASGKVNRNTLKKLIN